MLADGTSIGTYTPVTLISFNIGPTSYQAEDGMTWAQWVASSYNTRGYGVYNGNIAYQGSAAGGARVCTDADGNNAVSSTDLIVANATYYNKASN